MMKLIVALFLAMIFWKTGLRPWNASRRHLAFALSGFGLFLWASTFDAIPHGSDALAYKHILRWPLLAILTSAAGLIASLWRPDKLLKLGSILIGFVALFLYSANVFLPR